MVKRSESRTREPWFKTAKLPLLSGIIIAGSFFNAASAQQTAVDLQGNSVNLFADSHGKVVVLVFVRRDCPVSSRYAPVIQSIGKRYENDTIFFLVYPDKADTPQQIRSYLHDYGYALPALRDPNHVLVKLAHVQITPEVAVFDGNHQLIYDGRIDNWYIDLNRARPKPTTHELDDAIQSALSGKPAAAREARGVGCYISDIE
ncbi:MAG: redoxin domain-containing protein [Candidatus Sulfotelmatobacter sp.]